MNMALDSHVGVVTSAFELAPWFRRCHMQRSGDWCFNTRIIPSVISTLRSCRFTPVSGVLSLTASLKPMPC